ncbi:MAG: type II toxin-antitoxin system prevent-host-death family antitoxin [Deferribacteraceae bacterium]|jgi:prevent-host-death family protein|nr:type II toxin-antitoxin system prevent-host-death family antitoxin [Deferribacteraceae bacterium]
MPAIRPITDLRNTNEISELCHEQDEPIFITKNGYGDLVVMSIAAYDKQLAKLDLYKKLAEGEAQAKDRSSLISADDVFKMLDEKYAK